MADDNNNYPPDNNPLDESSPSALFLEMMRQAARQSESEPNLIEQELREADLAESTPSDDIDDYYDNPAFDFEYLPEPEIDLFVPDNHDDDSVEDEISYEDENTAEDNVAVSDELDELFEEDISSEPDPDMRVIQPRVPIYPAPEDVQADDERSEQLEAQRVRRLHRRQQRRQRRRVGIVGGFFRTSLITLIAAALASTIFTWFTDPDFFTPQVVTGLQVADSTSVAAVVPLTPTTIAVTPNWARRIGIVSGHRGPEDDPGAVCPDGLEEREINFGVAQLVVRNLRERGYSVDLLDEFDPRLEAYQAAALVSIHANDCQDYGEYVSGYLVARAAARPAGGLDDVLAECVARDYGEAAQIERRFSLTVDMTDYHTFREIHALTPAAIVELGFMKDDRDLLTNQQDLLATGITEGILCFLSGEDPEARPTLLPNAAISPEPLVQPTVGN